MYEDKTFSASNEKELTSLLSDKNHQQNNYNIKCNTTPILTSKIQDFADFYSLAEQHKNNPQQVIQEIKTSNLRGRGGAGFPFWFKLDAVVKE